MNLCMSVCVCSYVCIMKPSRHKHTSHRPACHHSFIAFSFKVLGTESKSPAD